MPKFNVKDLHTSTTLVAVGFGLIGCFEHPTGRAGYDNWAFAIGWLTGGTLIGAGLFALFKRLWTGAVVGLFIQTLIVVINFV